MDENEMTTIAIKKNDLVRLKSIKAHPNISDHETFGKLLDFWNRYKGVVDSHA